MIAKIIMPQTRTSILLLGLLSAFSLLSFDLYQPSLPYITEYFSTTHSLSQFTLSIYLLVFGVTQLVWGPLIDHYGRRRLLPASLLMTALASIICAYAPNITVLIIGRALQGFGLCCANLIATSAARDFEDSLERAKVISYVSMILSISPILAPVIGSLIFTYINWQANFFIMAAIALILIIQSNKALLESPFWSEPNKPFRLQKVIDDYKQVSALPIVWYGSLIMMFSFAAIMLSIINSTYLIIDVMGYSPLSFSIIFILNGLNIIVGNYIGIGLRKYFSMSVNIYIGNACIILGGLAMLITSIYFEFSLYTFAFALVVNTGMSISAPPTMSTLLTDFKENTGVVLAIMNSLRMLGSTLLSMLVSYLIMDDINALALGLIATGIAALYCSWRFNRLTAGLDSDFDDAQAIA